MIEKLMRNNILKQGGVYRLILLLMLFVNIAFVWIEIYKFKIIEPLLGKSTITKSEYNELVSLSHYAQIFEIAIIVLSVISVLMIFTKKHKPFLKNYLVIQMIFLMSLSIRTDQNSIKTRML